MSALLNVSNINCRYGNKVIVESLDFAVSEGSIACLLGPSGCGKTTVLRAIAGFEDIHAGTIHLNGKVLSQAGQTLPPEQRQVGMVFQDYALFPHLNVWDNIAFGLTHHTSIEKKQIVSELLELIQLSQYAQSYPHQLSGGQQQRIALARALAPKPALLLLDEPFSNLDTELRRALSLEVRNILKQQGTTAILVTHDQTEAFSMADEIGVMDKGKLLQWGSAQTLFHSPASPFVAAFVSNGKCIPARLLGNNRVRTVFGETELEPEQLEQAQTEPGKTEAPTEASHTASLLLRPWNVIASNEGACQAEIIEQQFNGALTITSLRLEDGTVLISNDEVLAMQSLNSQVNLALSTRYLRIFR